MPTMMLISQLEDPDQAQQQHSALAAAVVAKFVGTGKLVGVRRASIRCHQLPK